MSTKIAQKPLYSVYRRLLAAYGAQHWWPAKTRLETILGAILTQNTAWSNVERSIQALNKEGLINVHKLRKIPINRLKRLIKSSGFFNQKSARIKFFITFLDQHYNGSLSKFLAKQSLIESRTELLNINGIGPETADSILLYAAKKPVFVIDAYTRRIFSRIGLIDSDLEYDQMRLFFENNLDRDVRLFNEYHALIVRHAKEHCRKKPICSKCPLEIICEKNLNP